MYYFLFLVGCILLLTKENKTLFYLLSISLFLISIFRFGVGADYFSYQYLYQNLNTNLIAEILTGVGEQEVLFRTIGSILKKIGFSYQQYLSVFLVINMFYMTKICKEFSSRPTWSLFLYYCFFYFVWTFSGLRQGTALAIGMYYFLKAKKVNNRVLFSIIVLLLILIHNSSLIILIYYYLSEVNWNRSRLIIFSTISLLFSIFPLSNLFGLVHNIPIINGIIYYVPNEYSLSGIIDIQGIARILFLSFGFFCYKSFEKNRGEQKYIIDTFIISLNFYFILKSSELVAARLSIYGFFLVILIIPEVYTLMNKKENKLVFKFIMILFCAMYMNKELVAMKESSYLVTKNEIMVPYTNIFNKNKGYYFSNRYIDIIDLD